MLQSNGTDQRLVLNVEWRLALFTIVLVPLLTSLGFWQLSRADEKAELQARHTERMAMSAASIKELLAEDAHARVDRRVAMTGRWQPGGYLLLDNRTRQGRPGFEVLAFLNSDGWLVPVNLGWVAGDPARRVLPDISLSEGNVQLTGRVYVPSGDSYVLSEENFPEQLPAVIQSFPVDRWRDAIEDASGAVLFPHEVRIAANSPHAFAADWPVINQSPAKHTGYAVQWFTMAAVLFVAFVFRSSNLWSLLRPTH